MACPFLFSFCSPSNLLVLGVEGIVSEFIASILNFGGGS